ncbi:hypothetical protein VTI74DRAFT_6772 [Chaetomium olivicolor]
MDVSTTLQACTCADDVVVAWKHVDSMNETAFDVILRASEQTIDFSRQSQACWARGCHSSSNVREILLQIFSKLVDLLAEAMATYNINTKPAAKSLVDRKLGRPDTRWSWESCQMQLSSQAKSSPARQVMCLPAKMLLGGHELDKQQSSQLALDLVCRTLRSFADVLRRMGHQENEDFTKRDGTLLKLLARVERLADTSMAGLSPSCLQHHDLLYGRGDLAQGY